MKVNFTYETVVLIIRNMIRYSQSVSFSGIKQLTDLDSEFSITKDFVCNFNHVAKVAFLSLFHQLNSNGILNT